MDGPRRRRRRLFPTVPVGPPGSIPDRSGSEGGRVPRSIGRMGTFRIGTRRCSSLPRDRAGRVWGGEPGHPVLVRTRRLSLHPADIHPTPFPVSRPGPAEALRPHPRGLLFSPSPRSRIPFCPDQALGSERERSTVRVSVGPAMAADPSLRTTPFTRVLRSRTVRAARESRLQERRRTVQACSRPDSTEARKKAREGRRGG